jgi:hypothetical protein
MCPSGEDFGSEHFPHDDVLVLSLKMAGTKIIPRQRVKRILVNIDSSTDVLYKSTFYQMGLSSKIYPK